ncbi:MAG: VanZ family protein [Saprospiraceae bacterium]
MILSLYNWLKNNKVLNLIILITYYLLVVLPHEEVGKWVARTLDEPFGRDTYNLIILVLGILGGLGYLIPFWKGVNKLEEGKGRTWFALILTLLFIILSFNILLVVNVEIIHFVQYLVLAILLFPLLNSYRDTLFYAMLFATADEAYQYLVLAPLRTDYFDFNDVIIDLIGAALGLLLLWSVGIREKITQQKWFQTPTFIGFTILSITVLVAYLTGFLAVYPSESETQAPLLLIRKIQENFWTIIHPNVKFHVVQPLEGMLILGGLFYFYSQQVFRRA